MICGIWPLTSFRNAEFMVNELRVPVPEEFMERMRRVDNAEKARDEGVAIAREMVRARARHGRGRPAERAVRPLPDGARRRRRPSARGEPIVAGTWQPTWSKSIPRIRSRKSLERAAAAVRRGSVVAIPTDALYTLVADPFNLRAVSQVFEAKGREPHRSLPILVRDILMAEELASELNNRFYILARRFWPGPLTIIVPASAKVPLKVTGNTGRLALRQSRSQSRQPLIERC